MGGYNHYSWCNCGWCIKDRGYRYTAPSKKVVENSTKPLNSYTCDYPNIPRIENHESFTVPNVICNCCELPIFFYQSPYGGKVFFEELGPPWTKHCCEPTCCSSSKNNIPQKISSNSSTLYKKEPIWKKDGWIPCLAVKEEMNNSIKKIILKSTVDNCQYIFFLQKVFLNFKLEEGFILSFKKLNELFFEISFYYIYNKSKVAESKILVTSNGSSDYLRFCYLINNGIKLLENKNISDINLAKLFFEIFNLKNYETTKKEYIFKSIINHQSSTNSDIYKIYKFILEEGIKNFEQKLNTEFNTYSNKVVEILYSLPSKVYLSKIKKIIDKNRKGKKIKPLNIKKDKSNLNPKRDSWKGISVYKKNKR